MRGLILQLARLDSEAEAQVRIVDFFDSLLRSHATLETVLRSTAGLTAVPIGVTMAATGEVIGFDGQGRRLETAPTGAGIEQRMVVAGGTTVAHVWMCDQDAPTRARDLVLERLVLTCEILWATDDLGTQARALDRLLDPATPARERERIATLLRGSNPPAVRTLFVQPAHHEEATREWFTEVEAALTRSLGLGRRQLLSSRAGSSLWVIAPTPTEPDEGLPAVPGALLGVGPVAPLADAGRSGQLARAALGFALASGEAGPVVDYDRVGPICLLDVATNPLLLADPLVAAVVGALADDPGADPVLTALAEQGSIRAAAKQLHMHHSSVAGRVERLEQVTGQSLRGPGTMFSLRLALARWRATRPADSSLAD